VLTAEQKAKLRQAKLANRVKVRRENWLQQASLNEDFTQSKQFVD
jgi:hypothetical protein